MRGISFQERKRVFMGTDPWAGSMNVEPLYSAARTVCGEPPEEKRGCRRTSENDRGDNWADTRAFRRIPYSVPIYEKKDLKKKGMLRDITENGVGILGLRTEVGKTETLVIAPTDFLDIDPLVFDARCRWIKKGSNGEYLAGFEITRISSPNLRELRKLIRLIQQFD